jgi:hypothetical protein
MVIVYHKRATPYQIGTFPSAGVVSLTDSSIAFLALIVVGRVPDHRSAIERWSCFR